MLSNGLLGAVIAISLIFGVFGYLFWRWWKRYFKQAVRVNQARESVNARLSARLNEDRQHAGHPTGDLELGIPQHGYTSKGWTRTPRYPNDGQVGLPETSYVVMRRVRRGPCNRPAPGIEAISSKATPGRLSQTQSPTKEEDSSGKATKLHSAQSQNEQSQGDSQPRKPKPKEQNKNKKQNKQQKQNKQPKQKKNKGKKKKNQGDQHANANGKKGDRVQSHHSNSHGNNNTGPSKDSNRNEDPVDQFAGWAQSEANNDVLVDPFARWAQSEDNHSKGNNGDKRRNDRKNGTPISSSRHKYYFRHSVLPKRARSRSSRTVKGTVKDNGKRCSSGHQHTTPRGTPQHNTSPNRSGDPTRRPSVQRSSRPASYPQHESSNNHERKREHRDKAGEVGPDEKRNSTKWSASQPGGSHHTPDEKRNSANWSASRPWGSHHTPDEKRNNAMWSAAQPGGSHHTPDEKRNSANWSASRPWGSHHTPDQREAIAEHEAFQRDAAQQKADKHEREGYWNKGSSRSSIIGVRGGTGPPSLLPSLIPDSDNLRGNW